MSSAFPCAQGAALPIGQQRPRVGEAAPAREARNLIYSQLQTAAVQPSNPPGGIGRTLRFAEPLLDEPRRRLLAVQQRARPSAEAATAPARPVRSILRNGTPPPNGVLSRGQRASFSSRDDGGQQRPSALRRQEESSPEPQLLVVRLLYLSRLPESGWFDRRKANYVLSVHVGEDARNDPPQQPGRYSTHGVQAMPPQAVSPEEEAIRQRITQAIDAMSASNPEEYGAGDRGGAGALECRFKARTVINLKDEGPGPAAGGPPYFRVDIWVERERGLLGREVQRELFARVFVPLNQPKWQRRPCTWPAVDAVGKNVTYLTCEFAFAYLPAAVQGLEAVGVTPDEITLSWRPPPHDRVAPILSYRVEASALPRRGQQYDQAVSSRTLAWQPIGDVEPSAEPGVVAQNLRPNTTYRFRIYAVNEAGQGALAETEADTGPCAPGVCGQPRLAGCTGPVLTVQWDAPADDGGEPVVAYRVWVRPCAAPRAATQEQWLEVGHVRHNKAGVQRAEIHTEDLNPSVSRYHCSVAALNAAGEIGPSTPDAVCLSFPNPCAICGPSPQAAPPLPEYRPAANARSGIDFNGGEFWNRTAQLAGGTGTMMLIEPGKQPLSFPILSTGLPEEPPVATLIEPHVLAAYDARTASRGQSQDWYDGAPAGLAGQPLPAKPEAFNEMEHSMYSDCAGFNILGETISLGPTASSMLAMEQVPFEIFQVQEQHDMMRQKLQEKREMLESSLMRCRHVGSQLSFSPENHVLQQNHELAEIEAAGYQAEVAVLSQHLNELDETLRAHGDSPTLPDAGNLGFDGHMQFDARNFSCPDSLAYNSHL